MGSGVLECGEEAGPYLSKSKPLFLAFGKSEKFKKQNCDKKWIPVLLEKRAWAALPFTKWGPGCCVWAPALCTAPWSSDNSPVQGHVSSTGCENGVDSLDGHSCSSCLWGLWLDWGWTVRTIRPMSSQGALLRLRLSLFPGLAPFPVGCPLRHECNALLIQYSTKLKRWSWKSHMPNKQLCWQGADKPRTQATRSRFSSASRQRFVWQGDAGILWKALCCFHESAVSACCAFSTCWLLILQDLTVTGVSLCAEITASASLFLIPPVQDKDPEARRGILNTSLLTLIFLQSYFNEFGSIQWSGE